MTSRTQVFFKWTIECHSNESGYNAGYNDRMALHLPSLLLIIVVLSLSNNRPDNVQTVSRCHVTKLFS